MSGGGGAAADVDRRLAPWEVRVFASWLDLVVVGLPLFLGLLWPSWDRRRQTVADKIVGTVVTVA